MDSIGLLFYYNGFLCFERSVGSVCFRIQIFTPILSTNWYAIRITTIHFLFKSKEKIYLRKSIFGRNYSMKLIKGKNIINKLLWIIYFHWLHSGHQCVRILYKTFGTFSLIICLVECGQRKRMSSPAVGLLF